LQNEKFLNTCKVIYLPKPVYFVSTLINSNSLPLNDDSLIKLVCPQPSISDRLRVHIHLVS